jgi:hypothetical protein
MSIARPDPSAHFLFWHSPNEPQTDSDDRRFLVGKHDQRLQYFCCAQVRFSPESAVTVRAMTSALMARLIIPATRMIPRPAIAVRQLMPAHPGNVDPRDVALAGLDHRTTPCPISGRGGELLPFDNPTADAPRQTRCNSFQGSTRSITGIDGGWSYCAGGNSIIVPSLSQH